MPPAILKPRPELPCSKGWRVTFCSFGGHKGGFLVPHLPSPTEQVFQAPEGATAGQGTFVRNLTASQTVLPILAWRPQQSHPLPNSPGFSEQGQLIFVSWLID